MRLDTPVRELLRSGDTVTGILTDDGPITAGSVVNAAGPWSKFLAESAGIEMDMGCVREQDTVWEARGERPLPEVSISNAVDAIYLRPLGERRYVVGRGYPKDYFPADPYNYKETGGRGVRLRRTDPPGAPVPAVRRGAAYRFLCRPL